MRDEELLSPPDGSDETSAVGQVGPLPRHREDQGDHSPPAAALGPESEERLGDQGLAPRAQWPSDGATVEASGANGRHEALSGATRPDRLPVTDEIHKSDRHSSNALDLTLELSEGRTTPPPTDGHNPPQSQLEYRSPALDGNLRSDPDRHVGPATREEVDWVGNNGATQPDLGFELVIDDRDASSYDRDEAERYLVNQVVMMLGAADSAVDAALADSAPPGLALITLEDQEPSAAETLALRLELDAPFRSEAVDRGLRAVLGGRISAWQLHGWLENCFFERHVELSAGHPVVWHLSTRSGTFQVLVDADRLTPEHLRAIRGWVRTTQGRIGLALADAGQTGDLDLVETTRSRLDEVRSFDALLVDLIRNGWRVGGDLDRAAKLAVLRSRGAVALDPPSRVH